MSTSDLKRRHIVLGSNERPQLTVGEMVADDNLESAAMAQTMNDAVHAEDSDSVTACSSNNENTNPNVSYLMSWQSFSAKSVASLHRTVPKTRHLASSSPCR